jgi:hypothetical protein
MFIIWGTLILAFRISVSFYYREMISYLYLYSALILLCTFIYMFWPLKNSFNTLLDIRIFFLKQALRFFRPIGKKSVRLKDIIFSGIAATFVRPIGSLAIAFCLINCHECREDNNRYYCNNIYAPLYIIQVFPFIIRILQALNVVIYKKLYWPHLVNSSRFLIGALRVTFSFLYNIGKLIN